MACINCGAGLHFECIRIENQSCCCQNSNSPAPVAEFEEEFRKIRKGKRDATLKDQQSTGRKRAAVAYPLDRDAKCEWQGLKFAGGGLVPIVGCRKGLQQARHHGPDKNTLNNDEGNVHRICHKCHNRWHSRNDADYVPGEVIQAHDRVTLATIEDQLNSEVYYAQHVPIKVKAD